MRTAGMEGVGSEAVRVVWFASLLEVGTPKVAVAFDKMGDSKLLKGMDTYMQTKAGIAFLAVMVTRRVGNAGMLNVVSPSCFKGCTRPQGWLSSGELELTFWSCIKRAAKACAKLSKKSPGGSGDHIEGHQ